MKAVRNARLAAGAGTGSLLAGALVGVLAGGGILPLLLGAGAGLVGAKWGLSRPEAADLRLPASIDATNQTLGALDGWHQLLARRIHPDDAARFHLLVPGTLRCLVVVMDVPWPADGTTVHEAADGVTDGTASWEDILQHLNEAGALVADAMTERRVTVPFFSHIVPLHNGRALPKGHLQVLRPTRFGGDAEINVIQADLLVDKLREAAGGSANRSARRAAARIAEALDNAFPPEPA